MPILRLLEYVDYVAGSIAGFFFVALFLTLIAFLTFPKANYGFDFVTVLVVETILSAFFLAVRLLTSIFINAIYRKSGIKEIDKFTEEQFEKWLKKLFEDYGYKVKETRKTADYGADLIIEKDNIKIVVQAKRHKNKVGIKAGLSRFLCKPLTYIIDSVQPCYRRG